MSPALAIHINMAKSNQKLICNAKTYKNALELTEEDKESDVGMEYAVIYANLFHIKF